MESKRELISVKQAAEILNRTPEAIYKAIHDGRLHYADPIKRKLDRRNIEQHFARSTRPRVDKPMAPGPRIDRPVVASPAPAEQKPIHADQWEQIAAVANELIDASVWTSPPPWTADRWAGLAGVLDLARADVAS